MGDSATLAAEQAAAVKQYQDSYKVNGLGKAIFVLIVTLTFFWVLLYSFRPSFVRVINKGETKPAEDAPADAGRCFIAALIISLLIVVIVWMFRSCSSSR